MERGNPLSDSRPGRLLFPDMTTLLLRNAPTPRSGYSRYDKINSVLMDRI
ncbi:hypothetical protein J2X46_003960 [Nocardioides sp. BE266]|nr:hypothetical protein [Nocardioides sp. BE266]